MLGYTARPKRKFHKKKEASIVEDAEHFRSIIKSETRRTTYTMNVYIYLLVWVKLGTIIFFIAMTFRNRFQGLMVKTPESGYQAKRYTVKVDNVHIWIDRKGNNAVDDFQIQNHLQRAECFDKIVQDKQFKSVIFNVDHDAKMDDVLNMLSILTASFKKNGLKKEILFSTQHQEP
jgi:biopolymer transport protein ExbD